MSMNNENVTSKPSARLHRRGSTIFDTTVAGLYDLEKTIGKGHFAVVKSAKHVFTGERVAVKVIDKTKIDNVSQEHLFQEVRCMKLVQHPNIIRLYEVIDTQSKLFLILELGDYDMYEYIMRFSGGVSELTAQHYFAQIVHAISYCHKLHVVHRDLKPENVVFFESMGMVKLTDFGFSNLFSPGQKLETSCGSLAYSAPEILLGDSYDAPAIDVWSLGVILYMLVCGRLPFDEQNDSETLTKILDCSFTLPSNLSDGCCRLISKMLVRDASARSNLDAIESHSWVRNGQKGYAEALPLVSPNHLTEREHQHIVDQMVKGTVADAENIHKTQRAQRRYAARSQSVGTVEIPNRDTRLCPHHQRSSSVSPSHSPPCRLCSTSSVATTFNSNAPKGIICSDVSCVFYTPNTNNETTDSNSSSTQSSLKQHSSDNVSLLRPCQKCVLTCPSFQTSKKSTKIRKSVRFDNKEQEKSLESDEYSYVSATYYLLAERMLRKERLVQAQRLNHPPTSHYSSNASTSGSPCQKQVSGISISCHCNDLSDKCICVQDYLSGILTTSAHADIAGYGGTGNVSDVVITSSSGDQGDFRLNSPPQLAKSKLLSKNRFDLLTLASTSEECEIPEVDESLVTQDDQNVIPNESGHLKSVHSLKKRNRPMFGIVKEESEDELSVYLRERNSRQNSRAGSRNASRSSSPSGRRHSTDSMRELEELVEKVSGEASSRAIPISGACSTGPSSVYGTSPVTMGGSSRSSRSPSPRDVMIANVFSQPGAGRQSPVVNKYKSLPGRPPKLPVVYSSPHLLEICEERDEEQVGDSADVDIDSALVGPAPLLRRSGDSLPIQTYSLVRSVRPRLAVLSPDVIRRYEKNRASNKARRSTSCSSSEASDDDTSVDKRLHFIGRRCRRDSSDKDDDMDPPASGGGNNGTNTTVYSKLTGVGLGSDKGKMSGGGGDGHNATHGHKANKTCRCIFEDSIFRPIHVRPRKVGDKKQTANLDDFPSKLASRLQRLISLAPIRELPHWWPTRRTMSNVPTTALTWTCRRSDQNSCGVTRSWSIDLMDRGRVQRLYRSVSCDEIVGRSSEYSKTVKYRQKASPNCNKVSELIKLNSETKRCSSKYIKLLTDSMGKCNVVPTVNLTMHNQQQQQQQQHIKHIR